MEIVAMEFKPVDRQSDWVDRANRALVNAVSVVMYETPAFGQGEDQKTLHIFAVVEKHIE